MKTKIIYSVIAIIIGLMSYLYLTNKPIVGKYPIGSCFIDQDLKVKFRVIKISQETYDIEVVNSGHYSMSPEYQMGSRLVFDKSTLEKQLQYHPTFCENAKPDLTKPDDSIPAN